jgi:hypothetical protein
LTYFDILLKQKIFQNYLIHFWFSKLFDTFFFIFKGSEVIQ